MFDFSIVFMRLPENYTDEEILVIEDQYQTLLDAWKTNHTPENEERVNKAFLFAAEAHKDARRKSGEPYFYHPIAVAMIVASEMDLGCTSIICSLLHDVVEDTEYTLDDIEREFGKSVRDIVDGLTKIDKLAIPDDESMQAANFKKIVSTMVYDIRPVFIKIADRLHNMRTLDSMPYHKKLRISSETLFIYAPLAYRLGLYEIKRELEDISLKYTDEKIYNNIKAKQDEYRQIHIERFNTFLKPVKEEIERLGIKARFEIVERSISDIWLRMREKDISFEEVYDTYVARVIIDSKCPENEKSDCWQVYAALTKFYYPCTNRLRDWISFPKANGYESLHAQVMGHHGYWVEVQIRTERMNVIAERGMLSYLSRGGIINNNNFDKWLGMVKESVLDSNKSATDFVNDVKMNLFADEIFVFARNGKLFCLPKNSTVLDFAYSIHTELGNHCVGANVNHRMTQADFVLTHGDQVEILTSEEQVPQEKWLDFLVTAHAKSQLKNGIREHRRKYRDTGKAMFIEMMNKIGVTPDANNKGVVRQVYNFTSNTDLYYFVAINTITIDTLKSIFHKERSSWFSSLWHTGSGSHEPEKKVHLLKDLSSGSMYTVADCCNPIPGDEVVAFTFANKPLEVHRASCAKAQRLMSSSGRNIVKAKWSLQGNIEFLSGLKIIGSDVMGFGTSIMELITNNLKMNMRSIQMQSDGNLVTATVTVYVNDSDHLLNLMEQLKKLPLVKKVVRINQLS